MGTPPASGSLDQIRNVQRKARFGVAEFTTRRGDKAAACSFAHTATEQVVRLGATTAVSCWLAPSSFASGSEGRDLFFSAFAQHDLLGQLPGLQALPMGGLETGQA